MEKPEKEDNKGGIRREQKTMAVTENESKTRSKWF